MPKKRSHNNNNNASIRDNSGNAVNDNDKINTNVNIEIDLGKALKQATRTVDRKPKLQPPAQPSVINQPNYAPVPMGGTYMPSSSTIDKNTLTDLLTAFRPNVTTPPIAPPPPVNINFTGGYPIPAPMAAPTMAAPPMMAPPMAAPPMIAPPVTTAPPPPVTTAPPAPVTTTQPTPPAPVTTAPPPPPPPSQGQPITAPNGGLMPPPPPPPPPVLPPVPSKPTKEFKPKKGEALVLVDEYGDPIDISGLDARELLKLEIQSKKAKTEERARFTEQMTPFVDIINTGLKGNDKLFKKIKETGKNRKEVFINLLKSQKMIDEQYIPYLDNPAFQQLLYSDFSSRYAPKL